MRRSGTMNPNSPDSFQNGSSGRAWWANESSCAVISRVRSDVMRASSEVGEQCLEPGQLGAEHPCRLGRCVSGAGDVAEHQVRGADLGVGGDARRDLLGVAQPDKLFDQFYRDA